MSRLPVQGTMYEWLKQSGHSVVDKQFFEVGTGHVPNAPIGFFLSGAGSVTTVDLNRRIDWDLTRKSLQWISANKDTVFDLYSNSNPERES